MAQLKQTPLHAWHSFHHGRMVDFAGWSMPTLYSSIIDEHAATRTAAGLFDISHMGRLRFDGPDSAAALDHLLTRKVLGMELGKIRYSLITNADGGILDDVLVYRLPAAPGGADDMAEVAPQAANSTGEFHFLVVNASNRDKIVAWVRSHLPASGVQFVDQTLETAMLAVQGPRALEIAQPLFPIGLVEMGYYTGTVTRFGRHQVIVSRTGYTGEDGIEIVVPAAAGLELWERLIAAGAHPVGLGARDTLRLEAAMPLYGHELSESLTPLHADLGFAVNLKDRAFIGSDALLRLQGRPLPRRIGLELAGKRVPRENYAVFCGEVEVGKVTSGTFSPTLQRPIAMAYVSPEMAAEGSELQIDIRGSREPARVVRLPFYSRSR